MNKADLTVINEKTGEQIDLETLENLKRKEYKEKVKRVNWLYDNSPNKMTLDDLKFLRKTKNRGIIKLDYSKKGDKYFISRIAPEISNKLSAYTKAMLFDVYQMQSHDGRIKYNNNKAITTLKDLYEYLNIGKTTFFKYVKPDIDRFNMLKPEKIKGKSFILLNPIFATKDREITETLFLAFYEDLKDFLDPLDFLYLYRKYEIKP